MRIKLLSLVIISFIASSVMAQGLKINPGIVLKTNAGVDIVMQNGSLINNGNGDLSNSNLYFTGETPNSIGGTSVTTVSNLYINKGPVAATLQGDLDVINNVVFQNGLVDLNGHNLLLSPSGLLVGENEFNHVTGSPGGYVSITVNLNAPSGANPGNLGASITSSKDLGSVVVQRGHNAQTNNGSGKSILRYYNIQPSNDNALNAVFRFTYLNAELNGLTEGDLNMWRSNNGGTKWTKLTASGQNSTLNFVELSGVSVLSRYTLSSSTFTLNAGNDFPVAESVMAGKISSFMLTPNPVLHEGKVTIIANGAFPGNLSVFAANGKKVIQQPVYLTVGVNQVNIDAHALATGTYYVVVEMQDGSKKTIPFTKQ